MLSYLKKQKFKQKFGLIELTKQLEREPCDSISFTHKMAKDILPDTTYVEPTLGGSEMYLLGTAAQIVSPIVMGIQATFPSLREMYYGVKSSLYSSLNLYYSDNRSFIELYKGDTLIQKVSEDGDAKISYVPTDTEDLRLIYTLYYNAVDLVGTNYYYTSIATYSIKVKDIIVSKPIPTITDVINRILDVGVPRPMNRPPKYHLDPVIAEKFKDMPAPEFFLPRMTLFEALLSVGNYIHGVPRLVWNEATDKADTITFDLLGLDTVYELPKEGAWVIGYRNIHKGDDYCGALDSYAENVVNTIDPTAGSVVEPFVGGWKTLRCESGVEISDKTAVIETDRPIYRIEKLEMGYTSNSQTVPIGDITKYVYEQAEYEGLFIADNVSYPNSVAYALCYKQGSRYITGFNTTSTSLLNLIQQFNKTSIRNILSLEGKELNGSEIYGNLAFRVTYIPMDNMRVRQYKPYTGFPNDNVIYNQQNANTVESNYYGENLKGKIARMGNVSEIYTVRYRNPAQLPEPGNIFDNSYIYRITKRMGQNYTIADIYTTPDFNRLSAYFGLNSNFRLYEVSERQSIDRNVMIPRIITIGDLKRVYSEWPMSSNHGVRKFMQVFNQGVNTPEGLTEEGSNASVAVMALRDKEGNLIGDVYYSKAVSSTAVGNSLAFHWKFEDNYSAGYQSRFVPGKNIDNIEYKQKYNHPYGNIYGEFYALEFSIADTVYGLYDNKLKPKQFNYEDQTSTYSTQGFSDRLPVITSGDYWNTRLGAYFSTGIYTNLAGWGGQRAVDKNSSEVISVTLQFHGQANRKSIVLGSKMWLNNPLITSPDSAKKGKIYLLTRPLNMLRQTVDLTGAYEITNGVENYLSTYDASADIGQITPITNPTDKSFVAWAIVDPTDNGLYIGENMNIEPNGQTKRIYFNFDTEA